MEELKLLIELVADLPEMALWVLIGFFIYKVTIVGSWFGVFRLLIVKAHSWLTMPKEETVKVRGILDGMTITGETDYLIAQIQRIAGKGVCIPSHFIHNTSVDWLRDAIDEKTERDKNKEKS